MKYNNEYLLNNASMFFLGLFDFEETGNFVSVYLYKQDNYWYIGRSDNLYFNTYRDAIWNKKRVTKFTTKEQALMYFESIYSVVLSLDPSD